MFFLQLGKSIVMTSVKFSIKQEKYTSPSYQSQLDRI
jgi:hypothetical protein